MELIVLATTTAMTMLQKTLIALALTAAIGTGSYEARQTFQLREQVQGIQQQQAPLVEQIQQLQHERDEATNRLALLLAQNEQLKSNTNTAELLRLRVEVTRLEATESKTENDPAKAVENSWLNRVNQLKQYAEQHPNETIPEFQFLTDREWLLIAAPDRSGTNLGDAMEDLKSQAETRFAEVVQNALKKYSQATIGQFPGNLSQLQPYCDTSVENILQQRYEIQPASVLPASSVKVQDIKTDWVIAGKEPIASNTANHIAIYTDGYTYFW
jgi:hypothetical protein